MKDICKDSQKNESTSNNNSKPTIKNDKKKQIKLKPET